jgi:hypothetical protein
MSVKPALPQTNRKLSHLLLVLCRVVAVTDEKAFQKGILGWWISRASMARWIFSGNSLNSI